MCTVTYLPTGDDSFLLTSNRDEAPHRSPEHISSGRINGQELIFPRDTSAGGTWIAAADSGRVLCVLNGAFELHERTPPYRRSRGLMALDYFAFPDFHTFLREYTFEGMEAFTMLIFEQGRVIDLRWDQAQLHPRTFEASRPHVWSSVPLYPPPIRKKREQWFAEWLAEHKHYAQEDILHWHQTAGEGDPWNDVVMNRDNVVRTVSITSIAKQDGRLDMQYHDLIRQQVKEAKIQLKGAATT
ncbi:MAG: hypothetical protein GVY26_19390 [Bacteroidetes bacterium]|jgi:uncharacterized protein with NRDE domain|nr:hypothetical protein [Bacteroidota bacterium]